MKKLQQTSTNNDLLKNIEIIVRTTVREEVEDIVDKKINEKLKHIPSTELFLDWMSKIMGELQSLRNNDDLLNNRNSEHTNQLENHEQRLSKLEQPQILTA